MTTLLLGVAGAPAANASMLAATCTDLGTQLAAASAGDTVVLSGLCTQSNTGANEGTFTLPATANLTIEGAASGTNGFDANPAAIVSDFLTNPRYGAGFPVASLGDLTLYSAYCQALGLVLSPMMDTQQEAQQHLADIVKITTYVVNYKPEYRAIIGKARAPFFANGTPPASTLVGVAALALSEWLVEIEATAVAD